MKKFLLSLATAFSFVLFLGSCTNEEDINNNGYSDKEKAKIETLMNLFDSYGWELDTTVSIEQRNKELLEMDYEKTKSFLEYMSNGIEFDNFEPTQQSEDNTSDRQTIWRKQHKGLSTLKLSCPHSYRFSFCFPAVQSLPIRFLGDFRHFQDFLCLFPPF